MRLLRLASCAAFVIAMASFAACSSSSDDAGEPIDAGPSGTGAGTGANKGADATTSSVSEGDDAAGGRDSSSLGAEDGDLGSFVPDAALGFKAGCDQSLVDRLPPSSTSFLSPKVPILPFYQWETNDGYCGETSLLQAGLVNGQWISQFHMRALCGAVGNGKDAPTTEALLQSGPDGYCAAHDGTTDYNAQVLLEMAASANAAGCLAHAQLAADVYDGQTNNDGMAGFENYLSWVKAEMIAGHAVTIGVLVNGGDDPQYDHIVSVLKIGTNHAPTDATYYADDVLYFDDHGVTTFRDGKWTDDTPAIPPGAGNDDGGCVPYVFGYAFGGLAKTRATANEDSANAFSILIPGAPDAGTETGGNGVSRGPRVTAHDYAVAVSGPKVDPGTEVLPVRLAIAATSTNGVVNPVDVTAGFGYESPVVDDDGGDCTNEPPAGWMTMTLDVVVGGLTAGTSYNLYEYDFADVAGNGAAATLAVPTSRFNAQASAATHVTPFVAAGAVYRTRVTRSSSQTVVFRAVAATAP